MRTYICSQLLFLAVSCAFVSVCLGAGSVRQDQDDFEIRVLLYQRGLDQIADRGSDSRSVGLREDTDRFGALRGRLNSRGRELVCVEPKDSGMSSSPDIVIGLVINVLSITEAKAVIVLSKGRFGSSTALKLRRENDSWRVSEIILEVVE